MSTLLDRSRLARWSRSRQAAWLWLTVGVVGLVVGLLGLASGDRTAGDAMVALVGVVLGADGGATLIASVRPRAPSGLRLASFVAAVAVLVIFLGDVLGGW